MEKLGPKNRIGPLEGLASVNSLKAGFNAVTALHHSCLIILPYIYLVVSSILCPAVLVN